jgi:hypothetical protein
MQRIAEEQYTSALEAIRNQGHLYPEISKILDVLQISLAAHLGDIPRALQVMEEALSVGRYFPASVFSADAEPPGYRPLFGDPRFERLRKLHQERYRQEVDKAAPVLNCIQPIAWANNPPLLIAFHGNASNIELEADHYRRASHCGWIVIQPQSAQSWTSWGYVWGDMDVTERQVHSYWDIIQKQNSFDHTRIVTSGISKGGEVALWSAMTSVIPACGFILVAPGGSLVNNPDSLHSLIRRRKNAGLRGYLIVGDQDLRGYEGTKGLWSVLREEGIACELEICHGLGHDFPDDFEQRLARALKFVTEIQI